MFDVTNKYERENRQLAEFEQSLKTLTVTGIIGNVELMLENLQALKTSLKWRYDQSKEASDAKEK